MANIRVMPSEEDVRAAVIEVLEEIEGDYQPRSIVFDGFEPIEVVVDHDVDVPLPWLHDDNDVFPPAIVFYGRRRRWGEAFWYDPTLDEDIFQMVRRRWGRLPLEQVQREWWKLVELLEEYAIDHDDDGTTFAEVAAESVTSWVSKGKPPVLAMVLSLCDYLMPANLDFWFDREDWPVVVRSVLECLEPEDWNHRIIGDTEVFLVATPAFRKRLGVPLLKAYDFEPDWRWARAVCDGYVFWWRVADEGCGGYVCSDGFLEEDHFVDDVVTAVQSELRRQVEAQADVA